MIENTSRDQSVRLSSSLLLVSHCELSVLLSEVKLSLSAAFHSIGGLFTVNNTATRWLSVGTSDSET